MTVTKTKTVVSARFEPELVEAIEQLLAGNPDVRDRADMIRLLVRSGIAAVAGADTLKPKEALTRAQYAERAAALVEALGDLLQRIEHHDSEGAVLLADGLAKTTTAYARDLKKRIRK